MIIRMFGCSICNNIDWCVVFWLSLSCLVVSLNTVWIVACLTFLFKPKNIDGFFTLPFNIKRALACFTVPFNTKLLVVSLTFLLKPNDWVVVIQYRLDQMIDCWSFLFLLFLPFFRLALNNRIVCSVIVLVDVMIDLLDCVLR